MKYEIQFTNAFKKQYKLCMKRGMDMSILSKVLTILSETRQLPASYKPHKLSGNYQGCWECHLKPDWLLVWEQNDDELFY